MECGRISRAAFASLVHAQSRNERQEPVHLRGFWVDCDRFCIKPRAISTSDLSRLLMTIGNAPCIPTRFNLSGDLRPRGGLGEINLWLDGAPTFSTMSS